MSDEELAAEIERRRQAREEVEEAVHGQAAAPPRSRRRAAAAARRRAPPRATTRSARPTPRWRCRPGSDFETVRKSYRRLMRKYHPDLHAGTPEKQRAATDLTQRLTEAYKTLEKHLRR